MRSILIISVICGLSLALSSVPATAQILLGPRAVQQDWVTMQVFHGRTDDQVEKQLKSECKMSISMVDRTCDLDDRQQAKLSRSGAADVTRFFRDVSRVRKELSDAGVEPGNHREFQKVWPIINPLYTRMQQGIFNESSLYQKVLRSTLSKEQNTLYEAELTRLRKRRWRTITRLNVVEIEKSMPLLDDQREQLITILDEQEISKPTQPHMDVYIGFVKLLKAKKQDPTLGGFLDEKQMAVIDQYCDRYRGMGGMFR